MKGRTVPINRQDKKILIVADSPTASTGFGRVTHNIASRLPYDKYIMGVNYFGDWSPEVHQYKIWPAMGGQDDIYGYAKLYSFLMQIKPEILFVINDSWVAINYKKAISKYKEQFPLRAVLYTPVDTDYIPEEFVEPLNECFDHVITYTQFGVDVLQPHLKVPCSWITHGVDTDIFKPESKSLTKNKLHIPPDSFVILTTAANNPRKRLDLTVQTISEWIKRYNIPKNIRWYYHGPITGYGWNILKLCEQYDIKDRLILTDPNMGMLSSITDAQMNLVYNSADLFYSTTQSEGFMLPLAEAMACKVPALVPDHTALSEWPKGGVEYIKPAEIGGIPLYVSTTNGLNTRHVTPDPNDAVEKLNMLYTQHKYRRELANKGYELVTKNHNWNTIVKQFMEIFDGRIS